MCRIEDPEDKPLTRTDYLAILGIAAGFAFIAFLFLFPVMSL
jgi:hypothetical protein